VKDEFYTNNRRAVNTQLPGGIIILSAYQRQQRGNDTAFYFEQESNFWYLTGIEEPGWLVVLDGSSGEEWLVTPDIEEIHRIFDGSLSNEQASEISGIKKVMTHDEGIQLLRRLAKKHSVVHTLDQPSWSDNFNFTLNPALKQTRQLLERTFNSVVDCRKDLAKIRAIKQPEEIIEIQKAIDLTAKAFTRVHASLTNLTYEYEVEAEFDYMFKRNGSLHAYDPIIAGGVNAATLHYVRNSDRLKKTDLLLLDIGAKVNGYCADISRTYSLSTQPSKRKQAIHKAVVDAQAEIISLISPGYSLQEYQQASDTIMKNALLSVDLLKDVNDEDYRKYFPHAISHGLGIDVHDSLGAPRVFEPGMVLTVEPGIYIPEEGIGVRIEDDILVTANGNKNLSGKLSTGY
jgi:Xaa-Pro aminopeptidase